MKTLSSKKIATTTHIPSKKIATTPKKKFSLIPNNPGKIVSYIILSLFVILFVYLLMEYISLRLKYKPLFDWWKQNGGDKYNKFFNIMTLVSSKNSALLYYIENYIFTPPLAQATKAGLMFTLTQLIPLSTYVDSDHHFQGVITPRCLCESVLPIDKGYDKEFNAAIDIPGKITRGTLSVDPTLTSGLKYQALSFAMKPPPSGQPDPAMGSGSVFTYMITKKMHQMGGGLPLWPDPDDTQSWAGLIYEWLNGPNSTKYQPGVPIPPAPDPDTSEATDVLFYMQPDAKNNNSQFSRNIGTSQSTKSPQFNYFQYWFGSEIPSKPPADNWMSRLGIKFDSPLVIGFINDTFTIGTVLYDVQQFKNLLGVTGGVAGGWMGFIQGSPNSSDYYTNLIHSTVEFNAPPKFPPCKATTIGTASAYAGPMISAAGMAAITPFPFDIGVLLGGIVMGVLGGVSAGKC